MEAYHGRGSQAYSGLSLSRLPPERGGGAQRIPAGGVRQRTALPLRQILSPGGADGRLTVPCLFCGKDHTVTCSSHAFLHEKVLAFSCAASGLDCCYVGEEGPVFAALQRLEEAVDKLEAASGEKGALLDELVMQEVLSELKEIAQRDGISCTCGSHRWKLQVNFSSIDLFCADCGGAMRIPAATASDIDDICCKNKLVIHGQD